MLTFLLVLSLHGPVDHRGGESWFGADKAKHFFMSAFVQSMAFTGARMAGMGRDPSMAAASAATAAIGIGKEIHDRNVGGDFSVQDLTWDAAGGVAAGLLLSHTRD